MIHHLRQTNTYACENLVGLMAIHLTWRIGGVAALLATTALVPWWSAQAQDSRRQPQDSAANAQTVRSLPPGASTQIMAVGGAPVRIPSTNDPAVSQLAPDQLWRLSPEQRAELREQIRRAADSRDGR